MIWKIVAFLLAIVAVRAADQETWQALQIEATKLNDAGRYQAAETTAELALREAERFGSSDVRVAYSLRELGVALQYLGSLAEAERLFRRGIRIFDTEAVHDPLALALLYTDLAALYGMTFRWTQAEKPLRTALQLRESVLGPLAPQVASALVNLGGVLTRKGDLKAARELLERALNVAQRTESTAALATVLNALGVLLITEKKRVESLDYLARAAALWRQSSGSNHPDVIAPLLNAGRVYMELHRPMEALPVLREAQTIAEASLGPAHPLLAEVLATSAEALGKTGNRKQAREFERRSQSIFKLYPERTATVSLAAMRSSSGR